jgi:hypothetical protein
MIITYTFEFSDGTSWSYDVDVLRAEKNTGNSPEAKELPDWTLLENNRCTCCTLPSSERARCPAAVDVLPVLERFSKNCSICQIRVLARQPERTSFTHTDIQTGLKALLGLVMATSACPVLTHFRTQAFFHLPFASVEETLYRTVGDYLIKQYFIQQNGGKPDFSLKGLDRLYQMLPELNGSFFKRICCSCEQDASPNAVVLLSSLSDIISMSLEERLGPLQDIIRGAKGQAGRDARLSN